MIFTTTLDGREHTRQETTIAGTVCVFYAVRKINAKGKTFSSNLDPRTHRLICRRIEAAYDRSDLRSNEYSGA